MAVGVTLDSTHAPELESWVESANEKTSHFPIQNLPFGVFRRLGTQEVARIGAAIGDQILDLRACRVEGLLEDLPSAVAAACETTSLNALMAVGRDGLRSLRRVLSELLQRSWARAPGARSLADRILVSQKEAELLLPAAVGDYTDFYASIHHATNVGRMFRPDNPLLPNYRYLPVAYHGRASSVVVSPTGVCRPRGQAREAGAEHPEFRPSRELDYELEVGFFTGPGNRLGKPIAIHEAEEHIFGLCLLNDWSARDIQRWEYQPLGPFLSKSFATTLSPWVVTIEALAPFRVPCFHRAKGDPAPLPHLDCEFNRRFGGIDLHLEVFMTTAEMRRRGLPPLRLSRANLRDMYWTPAQMVTHHSSNGCNLRPGDLLATGTVSGPSEESRGCLLERTWRGERPVEFPTGEKRGFLENGDEVIFYGFCEREGFARIDLGECRGEVLDCGPA